MHRAPACGAYHDLIVVHDRLGVRVSVTDDKVDRPVLLADEHPRVLGGRGLVLVHSYADDWAVDELTAGKAIWFRLNTQPAPPRLTLMPKQQRRRSEPLLMTSSGPGAFPTHRRRFPQTSKQYI